MKKAILVISVFFAVSSCSFVKDVQSHCQPDLYSSDVKTGSFNVCLKCDSLAQVVYSNIKKQVERK